MANKQGQIIFIFFFQSFQMQNRYNFKTNTLLPRGITDQDIIKPKEILIKSLCMI